MFGERKKKLKCEIKDHDSRSQQKQEGAEWTWWSSWEESERLGIETWWYNRFKNRWIFVERDLKLEETKELKKSKKDEKKPRL